MEAVRQIRQQRGLSQQSLAKLADVNKVTLVRIENDKGNPNVETLEKLARALEVEVADFFPKAQAQLPLEIVDGPELGVLSLAELLEDWHYLFEQIAERWTREAHSGQLFDTKDGAIAYSIAANSQAAQLFEIIGVRLLPTVDNLLQEELAETERHKLIQAIHRLEQATEAVNEATWAAAPELNDPHEFTEGELAMIDEAVREFEALPEMEQHRRTREVETVLAHLAKTHAQAAEDLRGYWSA
jgi:transcriptional regulator with XRE-family HTH domain